MKDFSHNARSPLGWDEAVAAFEQMLHGRGRAEATIATYGSALRVFGEFYREQLRKPGPYISRLQETDLQTFTDHLRRERNLSASSINRFVVALHNFSLFALEQHWTKRDIARDLKTYRPRVAAEPSRLAPNEVRRLVTSVDLNGRNGQRNLAIVQLLLQTGLRVGELCRLSVGDVTLHKTTGSVRVRGDKGHAERVLPLNLSARRALDRYLETRNNPDATEPLFLSERKKRLSKPSVQHLVKKYLCFAGREELSTHDLRHHFAAALYEKTGKLTAVQRALGHRSVVTTARYASTSAKELEEAVEQLADNMASNSTDE